MQNLALGGDKLIRNLSIENRNLYREDTLKKYRVDQNKKLTGSEFVLIVEYVEAGYWHNKPLVTIPSTHIGRLINSKSFKKTENESINFCTAKGLKMLTPAMQMGDLYQKYHDRDDKMLYFRLIRENSF